MNKDFEGWNTQKQITDQNYRNKFYHEREIWWCLLGINIGYEHDGDNIEYQRPILILKGLSHSTCLVVPLTSSTNKHLFRIPVGIINNKESNIVISQLRVIDTKRLVERICLLDKEKFDLTRKAVKNLL